MLRPDEVFAIKYFLCTLYNDAKTFQMTFLYVLILQKLCSHYDHYLTTVTLGLKTK